MADYSTTALLNSIKVRANIPTDQGTFSDTDLLTLASEELQLGIVPFVLKARSQYFVREEEQALVAGKTKYRIPARALGGKIESIMAKTDAGEYLRIPQIQRNELPFVSRNSEDVAFYVEGSNIVFSAEPEGWTLVWSYYFRPGDLVATTAAAQITAINTGTGEVTVGSVPSTWTTATELDFIKGTPGFEHLTVDVKPTNIAGTVLTFAVLPSDLEVGDWLAVAEKSPIAQVPFELHPMLAQRTAIKVLEAQGDWEAMERAQRKLMEMEDKGISLISPRSDQNPKKVNNRWNLLKLR